MSESVVVISMDYFVPKCTESPKKSACDYIFTCTVVMYDYILFKYLTYCKLMEPMEHNVANIVSATPDY